MATWVDLGQLIWPALCARCLTLKDYIYHPDRAIYPMKRARKDRGLDK